MKIVGIALQWSAGVLSGLLFIGVGYVAFVNVIDLNTGLMYDQFGRVLHESVGFYGREMSPGFLWEVFDTGVGIVLVGMIYVIWSLGRKLKVLHGNKTASDKPADHKKLTSGLKSMLGISEED